MGLVCKGQKACNRGSFVSSERLGERQGSHEKRRTGSSSSGRAEERKEVVTQSSGRGSRTFSFTTRKGSRNRKLK